jgi:putative sigma-54 modulation protein
MHIKITGVHIEITNAIHDYAIEKFSNLDRFSNNDTSAKLEVILTKTTGHHSHGEFYQAEGIVHMSKKTFAMKTQEDDLYKSIDVLKDMLHMELASHKDKKQSLFKRSAHKIKNLLKRGGRL